MQKIFFLSTRTKTGFEYIFTENIYEISLCWEESLCYVFPYDYPRGLDVTDAWTTRRKLLKSFSYTIYLQPCISIIHWNKYHVNQIIEETIPHLEKFPELGKIFWCNFECCMQIWQIMKQNRRLCLFLINPNWVSGSEPSLYAKVKSLKSQLH